MSRAKHPADANRSDQQESLEALSPLPAELQQCEAALTRLQPRSARLDRDRLLFEAGRAAGLREIGRAGSGRLSRWAWPTATAAMTAAAALLAIALAWRGPPQVVERIRIVEVERAAPAGQVVRAEPTAPVEPDRTSAATNEAPRRPAVERNAAPSAIAWSAEPRRFAATRGAIIPPAGMEFRLFEHLIAESTWRHPAAPAATDESSPDVISPRSLPHWLEPSET